MPYAPTTTLATLPADLHRDNASVVAFVQRVDGVVELRRRLGGPFTADELTQIKKLAAERGEGVAFAPGGPYQLEWADLAAAALPVPGSVDADKFLFDRGNAARQTLTRKETQHQDQRQSGTWQAGYLLG